MVAVAVVAVVAVVAAVVVAVAVVAVGGSSGSSSSSTSSSSSSSSGSSSSSSSRSSSSSSSSSGRRSSTMKVILRDRRGILCIQRFHFLRKSRTKCVLAGSCSNRPSIGRCIWRILRWHLQVRFAWQAQYLVMLQGTLGCSAHCKWRFICHEDQRWKSFCVTGAVFGDVGGHTWLLRAL